MGAAKRPARPAIQRINRMLVARLRRAVNERLGRGELAAALRLSQFMARGIRDNINVQIWLARVALLANEPFVARVAVRIAASRTPQNSAQASMIAAFQLDMEELDGAYETLSSAATRFPTAWRVWYHLGSLHSRRSEFDEAVDCFRRSIGCAVTPWARSHARCGLADCLENCGDKSGAVSAYSQATDDAPHRTLAFYRLADIQEQLDANSEFAERLIELLRTGSVDVIRRRHLHYALGVLYNRCRRPAEAFAHFHLANDLRAALFLHPQFQQRRREVDARIELFTGDLIANFSRYGVSDESLVFLVGMPRSGTTLVEQILDSHSTVQGLGEREDIQWVIRSIQWELKSRKSYPWCVNDLTPEAVRRLSHTVVEARRKEGGPSMRTVTKMPEDFWDLGLISILFPRARIIHCRRHPIDTCLSCYMQNFAGLPYASRLDSLAEVYRQYLRIMDHWRKLLPRSSMLEVQYEEIVANPEAVARELSAFCGIPFEEGCLKFHENRRRVITASRWEVRRPIYKTSVQRWVGYREFLGPLLPLEREAEPVAELQAPGTPPGGAVPTSLAGEPTDGTAPDREATQPVAST